MNMHQKHLQINTESSFQQLLELQQQVQTVEQAQSVASRACWKIQTIEEQVQSAASRAYCSFKSKLRASH